LYFIAYDVIDGIVAWGCTKVMIGHDARAIRLPALLTLFCFILHLYARIYHIEKDFRLKWILR